MTKTISKMFSKALLIGAVAVIVFAMTACGGAGKGGSVPNNQEELSGTWEKINTDGVETITIFSDGRYVSDISMNGGISSHNDRTYDYKDGKLTVHYPDFGTDSTYKVQIKDNQLILDNGNSTIVYTKK